MRKSMPLLSAALAVLILFSPMAARAQLVLSDEEWIGMQNALGSGQELPGGEERYRVIVDPHDLNATPGLGADWLNIMLIGTDSDIAKPRSAGSSDLTIIASVNRRTGEIKLTSLVRDMYVDFPGTNYKGPLHLTNAFGGPLLVMKAVNAALGMNIQHYCSINFQGYTEVIDILGGVELSLTLEEADAIGARRTIDPQILSGAQALAYSRTHTATGGIFDAAERNKKVLLSIFQSLKSAGSADKALQIISTALHYMDTNLTIMDIVGLAAAVLRSPNPTLETLALPRQGSWHSATSQTGMSVVAFGRGEAIDALHSFIYGK